MVSAYGALTPSQRNPAMKAVLSVVPMRGMRQTPRPPQRTPVQARQIGRHGSSSKNTSRAGFQPGCCCIHSNRALTNNLQVIDNFELL